MSRSRSMVCGFGITFFRQACPHAQRGPLVLLVLLLFLTHYLGGQSGVPTAATRAGYAGDKACQTCHRVQSESYGHTAHHLTSALADAVSILGTFGAQENTLQTANASLHFEMQAKGGAYFETAIAGFPYMSVRTERIDVVVGSGHRAQTYLYWRGDQLFELPVSYWLEGSPGWVNSPGYQNGTANFGRTIPPRCLECHASFIAATGPGTFDNHYDRTSLVPGVSCESCHGPGQEHVAVHAPGAHSRAGQTILNPARFSRDRQIDLCALCHNGIERQQSGPAFSYLPGQPLSNYLQPNPMDETTRPDVHGNQVGLLKRSRCFLSSANMTCTTCHQVHAPERDAASYSGHCLQCHRVTACGKYKTMGKEIAKNCIDCHMPLLTTNAILATRDEEKIGTKIRTHWIKVYPNPVE